MEFIFHSMSSKSEETMKTRQLLGTGYSFTEVVYTVQEPSGEHSIFYSSTETQKKWNRHL